MKLSLPIHMKHKSLTTQELLKTLKQEEVFGYCKQCNNFGVNHSCPEYSVDTPTYLKDFPHAMLMITEVSSTPLIENWPMIQDTPLASPIKAHHEKPTVQMSKINEIAMYVFNHVKDLMTDYLLTLESQFPDTLSSPPGACTRCDTCTKKSGNLCLFPDQLRFSLESLGFMVSDIHRDFFGLELEWAKEALPSTFYSYSCLFSKQPLDEEVLLNYFNEKGFVVPMET